MTLLPAMTTALLATTAACQPARQPAERQLTFSPENKILTNINVWSRDSAWIAFDTRPGEGDPFTGGTIALVNASSGEIRVLYSLRDGAHAGVVTCSPVADEAVFILAPENPTPDWTYAATRRRGVLVDFNAPQKLRPFDAMNYAAPLTPGALRGGSHVHVFNAAGNRISHTYEDEILAALDKLPSPPPHHPNQRNVAVAMPRPVQTARTHPRNHDGEWFSVLATRTTASPRPGSDDLSRACEEGWIGDNGYLKPDGSRQRHALAFQGTVTAADGRPHAEVFVVDLPEKNLATPGDAPLEGTLTTLPAPPAGTVQRRLTFTENRPHRGIQGPRHWLRSSPDGSRIAFLMRDPAGLPQLWTISPNGGTPRQITNAPGGIASAFSWHPDGRRLAAVADGSVCLFDMDTGALTRLTPKRPRADAPSPLACVISPDGAQVAYTRPVNGVSQIFTVPVPPAPSGKRLP
ncbi:MAG: DUF3748 domain-containing protein [Opitutaceae bacterium]|jgi:hypothetical protein|nr:DUF3748 domain-containing protein [Opitutaceae bacterium]